MSASSAKVVELRPGTQAAPAEPKKRRDLTDAYLRTVEPPAEGRLELRDRRVLGLVLRMTKGGVATWSIRARTHDGKQTRPTLGTWPHVGIAEARKAALAAIASIQTGGDPIAEKRRARDERKARAGEKTVAQRVKEWRETKENDSTGPWSARYAAEVNRIADRDIEPKLGKKPLAETTRADWTDIIASKRKTAPAMAAALFRLVSSFLGHAEAHGWISAPLLPRKGAATLAPAPAPRQRVLADAELVEVWRAAEAEPAKLRAFTRLLILTAAREMEVADIATDEFDMKAARWTIPGDRTKNGRPLTMHLCHLALLEIGAVLPEDEVGDGYKLLGYTRGSGFRGFSKLKARLDERIAIVRAKLAKEVGANPAPMPRWRWHDLRRTARTGMTRLGVPRDHAEAAINHISARSALERTYNTYDYAAEIIGAIEKWQGHVAEMVKAAEEALG